MGKNRNNKSENKFETSAEMDASLKIKDVEVEDIQYVKSEISKSSKLNPRLQSPNKINKRYQKPIPLKEQDKNTNKNKQTNSPF